jgi:hypothetical protein
MQVRLVMSKIREAATAGAAFDLSEQLNSFANDIVCHAVSGKFFREEGRNKLFRELVEANSSLIGGFNLEDYFPVLVKLDMVKRKVCARARRVNKMWDELLDTLIDDHARNKPSSSERDADADGEEESDFIHVLLSLQQEYNLTRDQIKAQLVVCIPPHLPPTHAHTHCLYRHLSISLSICRSCSKLALTHPS